MSIHEQKWTDTQKIKKRRLHVACPSMTPKKKKWLHVRPWTKVGGHQKKKKIEDKVTLSHVGKSTTQSRRTKYLKNGTLIEDYNESWRLKVRASRIPGAMYQWPTVQKDAQSMYKAYDKCQRWNKTSRLNSLGTKFKSFYLQLEGWTKSLTSVLVKI